ncbi:MAG TPA: hypothetical protein VIV60_17960, partial [Polyangiaceae bacterium]
MFLASPDTCPSEDDIAVFIEGHAGAEAADCILRHLDACESCRLLLVGAARERGVGQVVAGCAGGLRTFALGETIADRYRIS